MFHFYSADQRRRRRHIIIIRVVVVVDIIYVRFIIYLHKTPCVPAQWMTPTVFMNWFLFHGFISYYVCVRVSVI